MVELSPVKRIMHVQFMLGQLYKENNMSNLQQSNTSSNYFDVFNAKQNVVDYELSMEKECLDFFEENWRKETNTISLNKGHKYITLNKPIHFCLFKENGRRFQLPLFIKPKESLLWGSFIYILVNIGAYAGSIDVGVVMTELLIFFWLYCAVRKFSYTLSSGVSGFIDEMSERGFKVELYYPLHIRGEYGSVIDTKQVNVKYKNGMIFSGERLNEKREIRIKLMW